MELVVLLPDHPEGKVHVYELAFCALITVYDCVELAQIKMFPVIEAFVILGVFTGLIEMVSGDELPQIFVAITCAVPPIGPLVIAIVLEVLLPDKSPDNVQVYDAVGSKFTSKLSEDPAHKLTFPFVNAG